MLSLNPHDLLLIDPNALANAFSAALPSWANARWPVVVRRALADDVWLPVGLRGTARYERFGLMLRRSAVLECITPQSLLADKAWLRHGALSDFPCVIALKNCAAMLGELDLPCGPTGSVGFALASGHPVLRVDSDLDLVVRTTQTLSPHQADLLQRIQSAHHGCQIDIQIETGHGGFAFAEWMRGSKKILLKTSIGPLLTNDPWRPVDPEITEFG